MQHQQTGLARPCSANDLFHAGTGLQCGNCLAFEPMIGTPPRNVQVTGEALLAYLMARFNMTREEALASIPDTAK